jgi:hypothetical protein
MAKEWLTAKVEEFRELRGCSLRWWDGIEDGHARRPGRCLPKFSEPDLPCLQMWGLRATMEDGGVATFSTYQDDTLFGLTVGHQGGGRNSGSGVQGIYRSRALPELPRGPIQAVAVYLDHGVVAEVEMRVGDRALLLIAGEAEENDGGRLTWHRLDESILVFFDRSIANGMVWIPDRGGLSLATDPRWFP